MAASGSDANAATVTQYANDMISSKSIGRARESTQFTEEIQAADESRPSCSALYID
jgi:hypothetical protein